MTEPQVYLKKRGDKLLRKSNAVVHKKAVPADSTIRKRISTSKLARNAMLRRKSQKLACVETRRRDIPNLKKRLSADLLNASKCLIVIRKDVKHDIAKSFKATLKELRLTSPYTAIFMENSPENLALIRTLRDYVTYTVAKAEDIRKLIVSRASVMSPDEENSVVVLSTNLLVERIFEEDGLICIDDLVYSFVNGIDVKQIMSKILPFKLDSLEEITSELL